MSIFLTKQERTAILEARHEGDLLTCRFWTALVSRTGRRAASAGLVSGDDATWWYPVAEYLSDAAMAYALAASETLGNWLRNTTLAVARRPLADWIGPWYRDHTSDPPRGHLETAHIAWGVATAIDLAADVFTDAEIDELRGILRETAIPLCRQWLADNHHLANWRSVLNAGVAVCAAVLGDRALLEQSAAETRLGAEALQPDGSYAESLQYANYLAIALVMASEAIRRAAPDLRPAGPEAIARSMPWIATSMLYQRPLEGWGVEPRARAVNFNDCAATYRPSGDVLLTVAARCRESAPTEAGLARWLFDTYYANVPWQSPHNLATFGLRNDWGMLTLPMLTASAAPVSPEEAGLPLTAGYSNGNVIVRDRWGGDTTLAVQTGTGPLYGPGHLHGDLNSFLLVHRDERLLADPGHNCYRNLIHGLETSSQTHNTCTFLVAHDALGLQEDLAKAKLLEQSSLPGRREIRAGSVGPPVPPRGRRLLLDRSDEVTVIASEAGPLYGPPIESFVRVWLLAAPHVLFVVDQIRASQPVTTVWNWLLNNRDGRSEFEVGPDQDQLTVHRRLAGLKLFHRGGGRLQGPVYAHLHDAYHPEPHRTGEGRPGSGMLYRWIEPSAGKSRTVVHAFALDDYGTAGDWHMTHEDAVYGLSWSLISWALRIDAEDPLQLTLTRGADGRRWSVARREDGFHFGALT